MDRFEITVWYSILGVLSLLLGYFLGNGLYLVVSIWVPHQ